MEEKKEGVLTVPLRSISIWQRSLMECILPGVSFCCGPATSLPVGKKRKKRTKVVEIFSTSRYIELTGGPNEAYFSMYAFRIDAGPQQVLNDTQVSHSKRIRLHFIWFMFFFTISSSSWKIWQPCLLTFLKSTWFKCLSQETEILMKLTYGNFLVYPVRIVF